MNSLRFSRCVIWGLVTLPAALAGCATMPKEARQSLLAAREEYDSGDPAAAERLAAGVISRHPNTLEIAEAYYIRGLARVRQGRPDQARPDYQEALARSRRADLTARTHAALALLSQHVGRFADAADEYRKALSGPSDELRDEWMYSLGVCLQRSARWDEARETFLDLLKDKPDGTYAARARARADWSNRFFSIQCGVFSDPANAERLVAEFGRQGLPAFVHPRGGRADGTRPVYVGRFADYDSARQALLNVRRIVPDAYVVP